MALLPNQENLIKNLATKKVYYYVNDKLEKIHKSKEEFIREKKIIIYPFTISNRFGLSIPKIKQIEFQGWENLDDLPSDFKGKLNYGFKSQRSKVFIDYIKRRFPKVKELVVKKDGTTKIDINSIVFNLSDLLVIFRSISREKDQCSQNRKHLLEEHLSELTTKVKKPRRKFIAGDVETFLNKYDSIDDLSARDIEAVTNLIGKLPSAKIKVTSHFIETRDKMDLVYIEDVIEKFKKLMASKTDNEEQWQQFFTKNSWILTHLFSYQVILKNDKAYVGGKTIENKDGTIVDFLFESGFQDNFALLEIKTHLKSLLKDTPYRSPDVFSSSDELSGGINQCLDQKDHFIKEFGKEHPSFDPKAILIIGQKNLLIGKQKKCFELLRANQKNVEIVTFDELLAKLEALQKVLIGNAN